MESAKIQALAIAPMPALLLHANLRWVLAYCQSDRSLQYKCAELTPLVTPVKSVLLLPSAEVNYFVRSPKLGASETRKYSCTTRFLNATICAQGTDEYRRRQLER
jgi:hypothetical protein